jgi:ribosomal protein L18
LDVVVFLTTLDQESVYMKQLTRFFIVAVVIITALSFTVQAQNTNPPVLPAFSALIKTGKIQLDFISGFRDVAQIGVQRSLDSAQYFYTIGYVNNPNNYKNSYSDNKPLPGSNYYRLLVTFKSGKYLYTKIMLAVPDSTIDAGQKLQLADVKEQMVAATAKQDAAGATPTAAETKEAEKKVEKIVWHPSNYVYTTADGNINIKLPDAPDKKYEVKFFEPDGSFLFEIKEVKEPFLILEKAIFLHAGWFNFEIYESGKPYEKWNLFIPLNYKN